MLKEITIGRAGNSRAAVSFSQVISLSRSSVLFLYRHQGQCLASKKREAPNTHECERGFDGQCSGSDAERALLGTDVICPLRKLTPDDQVPSLQIKDQRM